jgi:hypothetical protein
MRDQSQMAATRHEVRGAAREPDGGTPRCPNWNYETSRFRCQAEKRGDLPGVIGCNRPILLKKSVLAGAAFPEFKKRTIWTLLRENQGSSVSSTPQISTQATLFCGQKS